MWTRMAVGVMTVLLLAGCYRATIDTGRPPSGQVIHQPWAHGFIYGLVPPATVHTAQQCPNGVARVETQISFLNQLVSGLTFGIYSPMEITVHCAARASSDASDGTYRIPALADAETAQKIMTEAVLESRSSKAPVYVQFD